MIPHHAAAILVSEKTKLTDPELIQLLKNSLETQAKEIEFMKRKLKEFGKNNLKSHTKEVMTLKNFNNSNISYEKYILINHCNDNTGSDHTFL
jgi:hypothetical protein